MKRNFPKKFFVYGSLRPDIQASYSDDVHNNPEFELTYYRAKLHSAKLFHFIDLGYPTIMFTDDPSDVVHGYILESDSPEKFNDLLDEIEECPEVYRKIEKEVFVIDTMKKEKAHVYYEVDFNKKYNVNNINKLNTDLFLPVESGDYAKIYSKCKVHA